MRPMGLMSFLRYSHRQPQGVLVILYLTPENHYVLFSSLLAAAKTDLYGMDLPWAPLLSGFCLGLANSRHCEEKVGKRKKQGIPIPACWVTFPFLLLCHGSCQESLPTASFQQLHPCLAPLDRGVETAQRC